MLQELEKAIGYTFHNIELLRVAVTHTSYANESKKGEKHNERLEFLGDSVLGVVVADYLFHEAGHLPEGQLTRKRASLVCEQALFGFAQQIQLGKYLRLGKGEERSGGRQRPSILSDAFEAVIAAIYLDGGLACARELITRFVLNDIEHKKLFYDSKTILQEMVQSRQDGPLTYELVREEGPDHDKHFEVCARMGEQEIGRGEGRTKKAAEQMAAYKGILFLRAGEACI